MFMSGGKPVTGPLEPAQHYIQKGGRLKSQLSQTSASAHLPTGSVQTQHPSRLRRRNLASTGLPCISTWILPIQLFIFGKWSTTIESLMVDNHRIAMALPQTLSSLFRLRLPTFSKPMMVDSISHATDIIVASAVNDHKFVLSSSRAETSPRRTPHRQPCASLKTNSSAVSALKPPQLDTVIQPTPK
ncbi:hypothetical protein PGTUg99_035994 [Puccinia graminis f. sp. tritici]|uniref:Uncharacterized protein n=1 Tax=Puccinia graminis f. sp. tritici TaxID=56615 RepID=A0A5B0NPV5_PUCGR|nr:hypothetical protein PGTUg99_035994 [Puccinia graminis f. sp. tritici]